MRLLTYHVRHRRQWLESVGHCLRTLLNNPKRQILLDKDGKPLFNFEAIDKDKLAGRRFIVIHTTTQLLEVNRSHFTHVLITRDGTVEQLVPFDRAANHVSNTNWKGLSPVKNYTIAIDLENAGPVRSSPDNVWRSWTGERALQRNCSVEGRHEFAWMA